MAIIKTSGLITDIKGSILGTTFQNSLGGLSMKGKSIPRKRTSGASQVQKAVNYLTSNAWRNMSQADRDLWNAFATFSPATMNNNDSRFLNGQQLYLKYACWHLEQFTTFPSNPAFTNFAFPIQNVEITNTGGTLTADVFTPIDETVSFMIFKISAVMPQSRKSPAGGVKQIIVEFQNTNSADITDAYTALFGAVPSVGDYVFIETRFVCTTNPHWTPNFRYKKEVI